VNDLLWERLKRKLETLPDDKAYQVLDYIEFLESKYAERPAGAAPFQKVAETLEDTLRAGRVPAKIIKGTMDAVGGAGRFHAHSKGTLGCDRSAFVDRARCRSRENGVRVTFPH